MSRGPKPAPPGPCPKCQRPTVSWKRGWCPSCYAVALRKGEIEKLPKATTPATLTPFQEEVLTGLMLGDGCLYRHKPTHCPHLAITRQAGDRSYLEWTGEIFKEFLARSIQDGSILDARTNKTYYKTVLVTRRAPAFLPYYQKWYPEGVKIVPADLVLTPTVLAVWFADDGYVRPTCVPWRMQLKLSTMGFSCTDAERLAEMLCVRYGEYFSALKEDGRKHLNTSDAGTRAFLREIDPVFPPGIDRKCYWRDPAARFYTEVPGRARGQNKHQTDPRRLSPVQRVVIQTLGFRGAISAMQLTETLGWYHQIKGQKVLALTRTYEHLHRFIAKEWVAFEGTPRKRTFFLTEAGRALLDSLADWVDPVYGP